MGKLDKFEQSKQKANLTQVSRSFEHLKKVWLILNRHRAILRKKRTNKASVNSRKILDPRTSLGLQRGSDLKKRLK